MDETTKLLHSTTDAQVWAQEWCRIASEIEADPERGPIIDEGWMIGWFANAMCVASDKAVAALLAENKRLRKELHRYEVNDPTFR